jgi:hypothetical protein
VTAAGALPWGLDGRILVTAPNSQTAYGIVADGAGGAIVACHDQRRAANADQSAGRIDADGVLMWDSAGVDVTTNSGIANYPEFCSDGAGGIIVAWSENRDQSQYDVYVQRVERNGYLGYPSPGMTSVVDDPNDEGGTVIASWVRSWLDEFPHTEVTHYSAWRWTPLPEAMSDEKLSDSVGRATAAGVDRAIAKRQAAMGWEFVGTVPAAYQQEYAYSVPSFGDSTSSGVPETHVKTIAHTSEPWTFWESQPLPGYSVDNLAPAAPVNLTAQRQNLDVHLAWSPPTPMAGDFDHYAVYRDVVDGFTPTPDKRIATTTNVSLVDPSVAIGIYYYVVRCVDIHENEGDPSNQVAVDVITGVTDRAPALTELQVIANAPNPFDATTALKIGLPSAADVSIEVFDVAGRRVFETVRPLREGWQDVRFDGRALPSGVYFYRVRAAGQVVTKKMVVQR